MSYKSRSVLAYAVSVRGCNLLRGESFAVKGYALDKTGELSGICSSVTSESKSVGILRLFKRIFGKISHSVGNCVIRLHTVDVAIEVILVIGCRRSCNYRNMSPFSNVILKGIRFTVLIYDSGRVFTEYNRRKSGSILILRKAKRGALCVDFKVGKAIYSIACVLTENSTLT